MNTLTQELTTSSAPRIDNAHWQEHLSTLMSWTLTCWIFLVPARGFAMGYGWYWLSSPIAMGHSVVSGAYLDLIYLTCVAAVFLTLLHFCRRPIARRVVAGAFIAHCVVALLCGIANAQLVPMLGRALNYAWLYNAGVFRAVSEPASLTTVISPGDLLKLGGVVLFMAAIAIPMQIIFTRLLGRFGVSVLIVAMVVGTGYCSVSAWYQADFYRPMLQNPIVAFTESLLGDEEPPFLSIATDVTFLDPIVPAGTPRSETAARAPTDPAVRNVLLIVLESIGAEYLPAYGSSFPVTPELDRYRNATRHYDSFYAHSPNTNKSLFSYLCSLYPSPSYLMETIEYVDGRFDSLPGILRGQGYRTGMFYSADLRYGDADRFLANRSFDLIEDARTLGSGVPNCIGNSGLPFSDGMDDATLMGDVGSWINEDPDRPFFATVWTSQTHYPYFVMGEVQAHSSAEMQNSYLNGVRETDAAIGRLLRSLEAAGRLDATLVVIVGDHGEAFGQHNQYGHGNGIYNENVHVPLLLINPLLFKGERDTTVGGGVDLAPTILDILRIKPSPLFQGRSLFAAERPPRVFFMTAWSNALYGYREGDTKVVFNGWAETYEVFNLAADPRELNNLADQINDSDKQVIRKRLAAWVQSQRTLLDGLGTSDPD